MHSFLTVALAVAGELASPEAAALFIGEPVDALFSIAPQPQAVVPTNAHWFVAGSFVDVDAPDPSFGRVDDDGTVTTGLATERFDGIGGPDTRAFSVDLGLAGLAAGRTTFVSCAPCIGDLPVTVGDGPDTVPPVFRRGTRNRVATTFQPDVGWQVRACFPGIDDDHGAAALRVISDSGDTLTSLNPGSCASGDVDVAVLARGTEERRFCLQLLGVDVAGNETLFEGGALQCIDLERPDDVDGGGGAGCSQVPEDAPALIGVGALMLFMTLSRRRRWRNA